MTYLKSLSSDAQIFDVFASRPEVYEPFVRMVEQVSRGESSLSPGERELLGAHVSSLNRCPMCVDIHRSAAKAHGVDPGLASDPKFAALLAFVSKLTETPHEMTGADADAVYAAGWDEDALHDAVAIVGIASFMNRFVLGLGIESDDAYREAAGRAIEGEGYASRYGKRLGEEAGDAEE